MPGTDLTPEQARLQGRFEGLIALAAPFLDLVLSVGDRISRIAEPEEAEYYPVRRGAEGSFIGTSERALRAPDAPSRSSDSE